jgi:hypothetical protein
VRNHSRLEARMPPVRGVAGSHRRSCVKWSAL